MPLRMVEIVVTETDGPTVLEILDDQRLLGRWRDERRGTLLIKALVPADQVEPILDQLQSRFQGSEDFSIVLLPIAASFPRSEADEAAEAEQQARRSFRVSREELYSAASESIRTTPIFIALTVLSAVVAAVGLLNDNLAVVIGAMMIAPLLSPNVTLALGTTLGDVSLIRNALKANLVGVSVALAFSIAVGVTVDVDLTTPAIAMRTVVNPTDLLLALAAGGAGTLAFTSGLPTAVIGVMVAVALLPPLVNLGLLLGAGLIAPAFGAFLLVAANVVCVNLAGVLTFLAQGVRPLTWWESERARSATRIATIIWATLLALLALILFLAQPFADV